MVISGPSGAGKTSVCRALKKHPRVEFSVSATTRAPREGERDGVDYYFLSSEDFAQKQATGEFLESASYNGNCYGTLRGPMEAALAKGFVYILEIEVQGTQQLRDAAVEGEFVFVVPPSVEELRRRLTSRGTDSDEVIGQRLAIALQELEAKSLYDHIVENDVLERAIAEVEGLLGL